MILKIHPKAEFLVSFLIIGRESGASLRILGNLGTFYGNLGESYGNLGESYGNFGESYGNLGESYGNLGESYGNLGESYGNLGECYGIWVNFECVCWGIDRLTTGSSEVISAFFSSSKPLLRDSFLDW